MIRSRNATSMSHDVLQLMGPIRTKLQKDTCRKCVWKCEHCRAKETEKVFISKLKAMNASVGAYRVCWTVTCLHQFYHVSLPCFYEAEQSEQQAIKATRDCQ